MASREIVIKSMIMLSVAFQEKKTSEEFFNLYCEFLEELEDDVMVKTTKDCIKNCRWFPTIAEILERSQPFIKEKNNDILTLPENYDELARKSDEERRAKKADLSHESDADPIDLHKQDETANLGHPE